MHGDFDTRCCAMDWERSREASKEPSNLRQKQRMELLMKDIRATMKNTASLQIVGVRMKADGPKGDALLQEGALATIAPPPLRTFDAMHFAASRSSKDSGRLDSVLGGCSAELYRRNDDLVLLKHPEPQDRLTAFVLGYLSVLLVFENQKIDEDS
ncbi:hypothetical protein T440DRAFT_507903 [Plenodomus tracheiphilus IPT5]|uniref:Uncharacterized protein n=1 Tax=Plenodomus tracheiphilus IPT5 TaxID=1408161 RepID=A0A6A7B5B4_9PLEO|nr:hypothetical protein T440DRAFT_507903 [Plenodomus tracheiphilus IPT5]